MTIVLFGSATVAPSLVDVGALLHARTKIPGGAELGTFTTKTRPTAAQADQLIEMAGNDVLGKVQMPESGSEYEGRVTAAITLYAAMLIELSFFPEQVRTDRSPYAMLEKLYESRIRALIAEGETGAVQGLGGDGAGGDAPADAAWDFPDDAGGLVGWTSRF